MEEREAINSVEEGNDLVIGGDGDDQLEGGAGNDWLAGGDGVDDISGGVGDDIIVVNDYLNTADTYDGGEGGDTLIAGSKTIMVIMRERG